MGFKTQGEIQEWFSGAVVFLNKREAKVMEAIVFSYNPASGSSSTTSAAISERSGYSIRTVRESLGSLKRDQKSGWDIKYGSGSQDIWATPVFK